MEELTAAIRQALRAHAHHGARFWPAAVAFMMIAIRPDDMTSTNATLICPACVRNVAKAALSVMEEVHASGNAGTRVLFQAGQEDARYFAREFAPLDQTAIMAALLAVLVAVESELQGTGSGFVDDVASVHAGGNRPVIPVESGHLFRLKSATHSG